MPTVSTQRRPVRCPCGSGDPYTDCCGALHAGRAMGTPTATTAEALMRSRFSAFAVGDAVYLQATWHPSTRPDELELEAGLEWRQLEIRSATAGTSDDDRGTIDFVASYWDPTDGHGQLQEHSSFLRRGGQWYYVGPV